MHVFSIIFMDVSKKKVCKFYSKEEDNEKIPNSLTSESLVTNCDCQILPQNMTTIKDSSSNTIFSAFSYLKFEHLIAGIAGGTVSTLILHPLDLIKVRLAVNDGHSKTMPKYTGSINAFWKIVKSEGYIGLYRGITPNVFGAASSWGSYFFIYNCIKTWIRDGNSNEPLGPLMHMFAAADAGILTLIVTNPIWVVKTRLCLQYAEDIHLTESKRYCGMIDALKKISMTEGMAGLYKGFVPGLFGVSHGAVQFMIYEEMKIKYNLHRNQSINTKLDTMEYIICAAISKLIAAAVTYPYQVIRARLQDHHHNYQGTLHCIRSIWRCEGLQGYYKGLSVNLVRVTPATIITFVVYEHVSNYLLNMKKVMNKIESSASSNITVKHS